MSENVTYGKSHYHNLTTANNFNSSIDNEEEPVMHSENDNIKIMISNGAHEFIK